MKILRDKETGVVCSISKEIIADEKNYVIIDNIYYKIDSLNLEIIDIGDIVCEVQKHKFIDGKTVENEKYGIEKIKVEMELPLEMKLKQENEELKLQNIELVNQIKLKDEEIQNIKK